MAPVVKLAAKKDAAKIIAEKDGEAGRKTAVAKAKAPSPSSADAGERTSSIRKPEKPQAAL